MSHQHSEPYSNYNTKTFSNNLSSHIQLLLHKLENINDDKKKITTKDWFVIQLYIYMGKLNTYVKSINVYIEILKIFSFFNQLLIVINQGVFSF
jgi:hypothetical protein